MACDRALDDIVTEFLLKTCRIHPRANSHRVQAALFCGQVAARQSGDSEIIPFTTGSVAEFYIGPMLPCIGDINVMSYENTQLAIPQGHPPPTQLPPQFHNYVKVHEIIDSHLTGYVYLMLRYLLTECGDDAIYNAVEYGRGQFLSHNYNLHTPGIHASSLYYRSENMTVLSADLIHCVHCLSWPSQAGDWPTRHRHYGWPDSATVDRVVSNGCDVVGVAHRQCRQHEWMGKHQWRLSFSRAEVVLINSWTPVQQIVYHMLRYFVKTERFTDCADNSGASTLSNYHIKTLMLWACELKSRRWWTDDVNLVRMCVELLHILAKWLIDRRLPQYFINNYNLSLMDNSLNATNVVDQLMSVDESWLSVWFVDNYVRKCSRLTPHNISRLFDDVSISKKLQNAASALTVWRRNNSLLDLWEVFHPAEFHIAAAVYPQLLNTRSYVCWMTEIAQIDSRLCVYFLAVAFLQVANKSLSHGDTVNDEVRNILATVSGRFTDTRRHPNNSSGAMLYLNTAAKLIKVVANISPSNISSLTELSMAYLYKAWRCLDSDSDSIFRLANVYLSVLYYTAGEYQMAIDHCRVVASSKDHSQSQFSSIVVQGDILPKIDDDIDNMLGLAVLYQHLRTSALNNQVLQFQQVSVFTTKSFALYLFTKYLPIMKCRPITEMSSTDEYKEYRTCIRDSPQLFIGDVLLFLSVCQLLTFRHKPLWSKPRHASMNANGPNSSDLVEFLLNSAVEHLTSYRQLLARDFGSVATIVTTDFEAMYAYKRGDYQRCLQLSTQNVHTLLYAVRLPDVPLLPQFIQLFDDDIVSLTALTLLVNPEYRTMLPWYRHRELNVRCASITQLTLSLYLVIQCQMKLPDSVALLVQTLDYIKVAQRRHPSHRTMDQLTLKLTECRAAVYLKTLL